MLCQNETGVLSGSEIFFNTVGAATRRLLYYVKATPQNTQKERPCGKIPPGRAYIRHSISAAAALI